MTAWDLRTFGRALGVTLFGLVVVWLVTATSDEGQLTVAVRAGRTLPLAPLCTAIGAALALGTSRVRNETRAIEALGRSPVQTSAAAAFGAALPSLLVGAAIGASAAVDVSGFYPRAPRGDTFMYVDGTFTSPTLGVRVGNDGVLTAIGTAQPSEDDSLPRHARTVAAATTATAGLALALIAAKTALRESLETRRARRCRRVLAAIGTLLCALLTLVGFQAAAARVEPAALALVPSVLLLGVALLGYRRRTPSHA